MTPDIPSRQHTIVELLYSYDMGGSEMLGARLAGAFLRRGYNVKCLSIHHRNGPVREMLEAQGIECEGLGFDHRNRFSRLFVRQEVKRWLQKLQPPVILHCQHALTLIKSFKQANDAGIEKIVMTEHTDEPFRRMWRYRADTIRAMRATHAMTVIHEGLKRYFVQDMGIPAEKVSVISNGVELPALIPRPRNPDVVTLLFVGRLHPDKDLPTLLRAFASMKSDRTFLKIAGDGPERDMLQLLAEKLEIGHRVEFLGECRDVGRLLASADIFVMSSRTEGLPMALIEAMAFGLPCVATAVGGIPEVLAGGCGVVVPPSDSAALAEALSELARSAEKRDGLAGSARRRIESRFSFDAMVTSYLNVFGLENENSSRAVGLAAAHAPIT